MNKRFENIQVLRGIAITGVVVFHVMLMEKKWGGGQRLLDDLWAIGQSGVDLFFIISGFVLMISAPRRYRKVEDIPTFFLNRVSRIYPLYWLYSLPLIILFWVAPTLINPSTGGRINWIQSFFLLPQDTLPLLMVGWVLVYEMYFYLLFGLMLFVNEKHRVKLLSAWGFILVAANLTGIQTTSDGPITIKAILTSPMNLEFIVGAFIARFIQAGFIKGRLICLGIGLAGIVFAVFFAFINPDVALFKHQTRVMLFCLPYALIVYGLAAREIKSSKVDLKFFKPLGDASYSIYLSHTLIINGIGWVWALINARQHHFFWLSLMIIISMGYGLKSYRLIEIPLITNAKKLLRIA